MLDVSKEGGIYVHIPFCAKKCKYCAFLSFSPRSKEEIDRYVDSLISEIKLRRESCDCDFFDTVYFGGGTPSLLSAAQLERILYALKSNYDIHEDAEITIEANPGSLTHEKLVAYRQLGFNRLSLGVQSMNDDRLKFMGRIHDRASVEREFRLARAAGFENINLDIIFSISGESTEDALLDIREIAGLSPEHISFYSLQLEEGTAFFEMWDNGEFEEVSDDEDRETYHRGSELLKELGYERYEISNFAKPGYESRHNSKYWNMADYLAFGLGASGMLSDNGVHTRYSNLTALSEYEFAVSKGEVPNSDIHTNSLHDDVSEAVFTGLRRREGIRFSDFFDGTRESFESYYEDEWHEVEEFVREGLLEVNELGMRLTESGIDISNSIMAVFV